MGREKARHESYVQYEREEAWGTRIAVPSVSIKMATSGVGMGPSSKRRERQKVLNDGRLTKAARLIALALESGHLRDVGPNLIWPTDLDARGRTKTALLLLRDAIRIQEIPENDCRALSSKAR